MIGLKEFKSLHHAITLLGMSGVGKTVLSTSLRKSADWYHYSADYRIGTRYLIEHILDNIKHRIMQMRDPFVANLLRSDSIYIHHNITVDNLETVSTYLGMYGDPNLGGLDKQTFLMRQNNYRRAEIRSMLDVEHFIEKAWHIYGCQAFVNDASGSLCEIVDIANPLDPVLKALISKTLVLYIKADPKSEAMLIGRARTNPKPLFYSPTFIEPKLQDNPDNGDNIDPFNFARPLFPELLEFRKPRYAKIAEKYGFTVHAKDLFKKDEKGANNGIPDADTFLTRIHTAIAEQAHNSKNAAKNLEYYLKSCKKRARRRNDNTNAY